MGKIARRKVNAKLGVNKSYDNEHANLFYGEDIVASIKYLLNLANHKKGYYEIDLKEKNNIDIKFNEIYPKRDIRVVEGRLEELLKEEHKDFSSYIK